MADVRVKLKIGGVRKVLRSPEVVAEVAKRAQRIRRQAGDGFGVSVKPHKYTARAFVQTETPAARREEAEHKTLTRALDAAR